MAHGAIRPGALPLLQQIVQRLLQPRIAWILSEALTENLLSVPPASCLYCKLGHTNAPSDLLRALGRVISLEVLAPADRRDSRLDLLPVLTEEVQGGSDVLNIHIEMVWRQPAPHDKTRSITATAVDSKCRHSVPCSLGYADSKAQSLSILSRLAEFRQRCPK